MSREEINPIKTTVKKSLDGKPKRNKLYKDDSAERRAEIGSIVAVTGQMFSLAQDKPKVTPNNLDIIKQRAFDYFNECAATGTIPTMEGLAISFGVCRKTLYNWLEQYDNKPLVELMERIRDVIADMNYQLASKRKIDITGYIFYSKNRFGMQDKTDIEVIPNTNPLGNTKDPAEIQQRLMEGIADEE